MDEAGNGKWHAFGGTRQKKWAGGGFTLIEVLIASVILALLISAYASVLAYQAKQRFQTTAAEQAYELMEQNLAGVTAQASQNSGQFASLPIKPITIPITGNLPGFKYSGSDTIALPQGIYNSFAVYGTPSQYQYYLVQITTSLTLSWGNSGQSITVTGTTLVAPQNMAP